jgi:hypothetical protein
MKIYGEIGIPCLQPSLTLKNVDKKPFSITQVSVLYKKFPHYINFHNSNKFFLIYPFGRK